MDLDMGKYTVFVWGAYGASFVALAVLVYVSLRAHAERQHRLKALQAAIKEQQPAKPHKANATPKTRKRKPPREIAPK